MSGVVIDCSLAIAWIAPDEHDDVVETATDLMAEEGGHAPTLFWFEIANTLAIKERRGRITAVEAQAAFDVIADTPLTIHAFDSFERLAELARRHALSAYDAAYLDLAKRRSAKLATLDRKLAAAAAAEGVEALTA